VRALVTGSAGFVGRHISAELISRGWDVEGWDIADGSDARILFAAERHFTAYDLVIHCAFHVGGRAAIDSDRRALAKNLELDAAMFGWAVRTRQKRVLYFSSSAVYPVGFQDGSDQSRKLLMRNYGTHRLPEALMPRDHAGKPDADYGFAKMAGEKLAYNAQDEGLNVHIVRPFSGYGEDQSLDYPFPSIVKRAREGDLSVWGPRGQRRDWIHISDVVAGALAVVDQDYQAPVNLCTGIGTEMGELAVVVNLAAGGRLDSDDVTYLVGKPTGVLNRVGDPSIFHTIYTPKISLEDGVRRALSQ
jgi:nucleoside-diphosphate-sugar epimerase